MKYEKGETSSIFIMAVVMMLIGGALAAWVQQIRISEVNSKLETANVYVEKANERIKTLSDTNFQLEQKVKLMKSLADISKEEAEKHAQDKKILEKKVNDAVAKLPAVKQGADAESAEDAAREFARASAVFEVYCEVADTATLTECQPEKQNAK